MSSHPVVPTVPLLSFLLVTLLKYVCYLYHHPRIPNYFALSVICVAWYFCHFSLRTWTLICICSWLFFSSFRHDCIFILSCPFCSISSTLMDLESTASSGRSTPAMLNGHGSGAVVGNGSAPAGGKSLSYTCCWDQCQLQFPSSPDLAEHIRATHVDGQRGGVSVSSLAALMGCAFTGVEG